MAEETLSPISAAKPPVANPITPAGGGEASTLKLKPVLRKPTPGAAPALNLPTKPVVRAPVNPPAPAPAAPAAAAPKPIADVPKALDQLKSVTQKLKGVTQEIPQQAILRKTGIISDQAMTEAQKQASKARTARISLSDAIGAAPVKEAAPMKTIRIKRPVDIAGAAPAKPAMAPAAAEPPTQTVAEAPTVAPAESGATLTQRKTLKVARPGAGGGKPAAKFSVKKPGSTAIAKPAAAPGGGDGEVSDIPDIPDMPTTATNVPAFSPAAPAGEKDVPAVVSILSLVVQAAACVAVGALGYMLYTNTQTPLF